MKLNKEELAIIEVALTELKKKLRLGIFDFIIASKKTKQTLKEYDRKTDLLLKKIRR